MSEEVKERRSEKGCRCVRGNEVCVCATKRGSE